MQELSWKDKGDQFGRHQVANAWKKYLIERAAAAESGVTMALNAPWGAGKSQFLAWWSQSLQANHVVVTFDAWKNDHAEDPAIAFVAELTKTLEQVRRDHQLATNIADALDHKRQRLLTAIGKATVPTLKALGTAVVKKAVGLDLPELIDELREGKVNGEDATSVGQDLLKTSGEAFIAATIASYNQRKHAIEELKHGLEELIELIDRHSNLHSPLFVFIDEVDRCRPDFAIRLLEGIKHLFSVKGIVFVLAVNADQLAKAVAALYGPLFDGSAYLQRFFDVQVSLPPPDMATYSTYLVKLHWPNGARVQHDVFNQMTADNALALGLQHIAQMFALSLRQMQQVALTAAAATSALKDVHIPPHWLMYLAAAKLVEPQTFDQIVNGTQRELPGGDCASTQRADLVVLERVGGWHPSGGRDTSTVTLRQVLNAYFELRNATHQQLAKYFRGADLHSDLVQSCRSNGRNFGRDSGTSLPLFEAAVQMFAPP